MIYHNIFTSFSIASGIRLTVKLGRQFQRDGEYTFSVQNSKHQHGTTSETKFHQRLRFPFSLGRNDESPGIARLREQHSDLHSLSQNYDEQPNRVRPIMSPPKNKLWVYNLVPDRSSVYLLLFTAVSRLPPAFLRDYYANKL
jgi:hypothetical protein